MLLDSFQRNTIQFWKESYLPRNFLLGHPLFLEVQQNITNFQLGEVGAPPPKSKTLAPSGGNQGGVNFTRQSNPASKAGVGGFDARVKVVTNLQEGLEPFQNLSVPYGTL